MHRLTDIDSADCVTTHDTDTDTHTRHRRIHVYLILLSRNVVVVVSTHYVSSGSAAHMYEVDIR